MSQGRHSQAFEGIGHSAALYLFIQFDRTALPLGHLRGKKGAARSLRTARYRHLYRADQGTYPQANIRIVVKNQLIILLEECGSSLTREELPLKTSQLLSGSVERLCEAVARLERRPWRA
jgi:hypothetical protein